MVDTQHRAAAHWLLEALVEQGIEYLFGNLGTDHAPLIEEMARWRREGRRPPELVSCAHENTAVHMAGGYALATGRAQAVLVHVDTGTANAAMALHNLCRTRVPVLVMAGRAPFSSFGELHGGRDTYVHFVQEPFDQAGIVRPYVKWEYTLQSGVVAKEVVTRACAVMRSDPMGPVYLMLPREVLASTCPPAARAFSPSRHGPVRAGGAHPEAIAAIAARLLVSEEPLLVTAYAGRNPAAVESIERLALLAGVRVCEFNAVHLNIRRDSPCFGGYQPAEFAQTTDLGLLVDVDVPWIPRTTRENPAAFWVQMDIDAIKRDMPMWSFPADMRIEGDSERLMGQLVEAVTAIATPDFHRRVERRIERMAAEHAERKRAAAERARDPGTPGRLNPHHVCAALGRAIGPDDIVLNEAIRNMPVVFEQIPRSRPGSLLGFPGGGLGFSGGMALGYKLACPHRRVVHVIGDGVFHFSNPTSLYAVARRYGLPVFTVVLDNGGWAAVKEATLRMYPDGESRHADEFGATVAPGADFSRVAESSDAHGEMLTDPAETDAAIGRCLSALDEGRSALLHVRLAPL